MFMLHGRPSCTVVLYTGASDVGFVKFAVHVGLEDIISRDFIKLVTAV